MQKNTYGKKLNSLIPIIKNHIETNSEVNVKRLYRELVTNHFYDGGVTAIYDCVKKIQIELGLINVEQSLQTGYSGKKTASYLDLISQFVIENDKKPKNEQISIAKFHNTLISEHGFTGAYNTLYDQIRIIRSELGAPGGKVVHGKNGIVEKYSNTIKSWLIEDQKLPVRDRRSNAELARKLNKEEGCLQTISSIMRFIRLIKLELGIPTDECKNNEPKDLNVHIESTPIKYLTIKSKVLDNLLKKNPKWTKNTSTYKVTKSAINSWMVFFNRSEDDISNHDFINFDDSLDAFKSYYLPGKSPASWPSMESRIKLFYRTYLQLQTEYSVPDDFPGRLRYLINIDGRSLYKIGKKVGLSGSQLSRLSTGINRPHVNIIPRLIELETKIWLLPKGYLTNCIKNPYGIFAAAQKNTKQTDYAVINSHRSQKLQYTFIYRLWPAKLKAEWRHLKTHFTSHSPQYPRNIDSGWNAKGTIKRGLREFQAFFGFALLPSDAKDFRTRGIGLKKSQLTIGLITNTHIVNEYIEFRRSRTINYSQKVQIEDFIDDEDGIHTIDTGYYSTGTKNIISQFCTYLNPEYGIIKNSPVFQNSIDTGEFQWEDWCDHAFKFFKKKMSNTKWVMGRDPEEPIRYIIEDKDPYSHLIKLLQNVKAHVPTKTDFKNNNICQFDISLYCKFMLLSFLCANPLRISMFAKMRFSDKIDDTNPNINLFKDSEGRWHIKFHKSEFKNSKHLKENYHVKCQRWLTPIIDEYLQFVRPNLIGAEDCDYFFRPSEKNAFFASAVSHAIDLSKGMTNQISTHKLSQWIAKLTYTFTPNNVAFRPHAFRHIIATDYIKKNPNGFAAAAAALHDTLQTVISKYGHLSNNHMFDTYADQQDMRMINVSKELGYEIIFDTPNNSKDQFDVKTVLQTKKSITQNLNNPIIPAVGNQLFLEQSHEKDKLLKENELLKMKVDRLSSELSSIRKNSENQTDELMKKMDAILALHDNDKT